MSQWNLFMGEGRVCVCVFLTEVRLAVLPLYGFFEVLSFV